METKTDVKNTSLFELKERLIEESTPTAYHDFWNKFVLTVNSDEWLAMPTNHDNDSYALQIKDHKGEHYIVVYSGMNGSAGESKTIINTSIRKIITTLYNNPHLHGIVLDPNKNPYYIRREEISKRTNMKDLRRQFRDWGKGIPPCKPSDIMVREELLGFAMQVIADDYIKNEKYHIIEYTYGIEGFPNFVLKKDDQLYLMKVDVGVNPNIPIVSEKDKNFYLSVCKKFNAICLYASVSIESSDPIRAAHGLVLCGDPCACTTNAIRILN